MVKIVLYVVWLVGLMVVVACGRVATPTPSPMISTGVAAAVTPSVTPTPSITPTSTTTPEIISSPTETLFPTATTNPSPTPTATSSWTFALPSRIAAEVCRYYAIDNGAHLRQQCGIIVYETTTQQIVFELTSPDTSFTEPLFSPDGDWLAYVESSSNGSRVNRIRMADQVTESLTDWFDLTLNVDSWSPDGQWLALKETIFNDTRGTLYLVHVETGTVQHISDDAEATTWSTNEPLQLFFAISRGVSSPQGFYTLDPHQPSEIEQINDGQGIYHGEVSIPRAIALHPQGSLMAVCVDDHELWVLDRETGIWQFLKSFGNGECQTISWSEDGQNLVAYTRNNLFFYQQNDGVWQEPRTVVGTNIDRTREAQIGKGHWATNEVFVYTLYYESGREVQFVAVSMNETNKQLIEDFVVIDFTNEYEDFYLTWHYTP